MVLFFELLDFELKLLLDFSEAMVELWEGIEKFGGLLAVLLFFTFDGWLADSMELNELVVEFKNVIFEGDAFLL